MKITEITIKDFMRIREVTWRPSPKGAIIVGKNASGKSSLLKAIATALKGSSDTTLIRKGATQSEFIVAIDDLLKIERKLSVKRSSLKVTTKDGDIKASPQKFLDGIIGDMSFDPVMFLGLDKKDRKKYLADLLALRIAPEDLVNIVDAQTMTLVNYEMDALTNINNLVSYYYNQRTAINKELKYYQVLAEDAEKKLPSPDVMFDAQQDFEVMLSAAKDKIKQQERAVTEARVVSEQYDSMLSLYNSNAEKIRLLDKELESVPEYDTEFFTDISAQIEEKENALRMLKEKKQAALDAVQRRYNIKQAINNHETTMRSLNVGERPDVEAENAKLQSMYDDVATIQIRQTERKQYEEYSEVVKKRDAVADSVSALSDTIDKLRALPDILSKRAKFPIQGITFVQDSVFYNDVNIDHLSTSEQVRFAINIVKALNEQSKLKAMCLDRIESLDDETFNELYSQLDKEDGDWQYFITQVQHGDIPAGAIQMKDGELV